MKLEHVILGLLSLRPFSGYELGKYLQQETAASAVRPRAHLTQIYRVLGRMVDDGWVRFEVTENDGKPDAKTYRLTEKGEQALLAWANSEYKAGPGLPSPEFAGRFIFAGPLIGRPALARLVRTELEARLDHVARFRGRDRSVGELEPIAAVDPAIAAWAGDLLHEFGMGTMDRWIEWLRTVLDELETEKETP